MVTILLSRLRNVDNQFEYDKWPGTTSNFASGEEANRTFFINEIIRQNINREARETQGEGLGIRETCSSSVVFGKSRVFVSRASYDEIRICRASFANSLYWRALDDKDGGRDLNQDRGRAGKFSFSKEGIQLAPGPREASAGDSKLEGSL